MIRVGREACRHLEHALTREWLETNGRRGFASSTLVGVNTRRYHGLLGRTKNLRRTGGKESAMHADREFAATITRSLAVA